jgi:predicted phage terminase large subunit-like protein
MSESVDIRPQPGPQTMFMSSLADIAGYGGGAGGGKSFALLLEPLRHIRNPKFSAVIFRRESPQITNEGALWDKSYEIYPYAQGKPRIGDLKWIFPSRASVRFTHLEHEDDKLKWQGSEVPLFCFDELTHFSSGQFFYIAFSRGRTMSGVTPYIRCAFNPDALSWVKVFFGPWVDKASPIKADSGEVLWLFRREEQLCWYHSAEEAVAANRDIIDVALEAAPDLDPRKLIKSVTFVAATVYDNKKLLEKNPEYLGGLLALPYVERMQLLYGDWDVVASAGKVFNRAWFEIIEPTDVPKGSDNADDRAFDVRFWDFAASVQKQKGDDPDWTVGTRMRRHRGTYYVLDVVRGQWTPGVLDSIVKNTAIQDGPTVVVRWEEEGGASGKKASQHDAENLSDVIDNARGVRPQGDKVARAKPLAAAAEPRESIPSKVKIVRADWNEGWLTELHHFPDAAHDDQVDSASSAFLYLKRFAADVTVGQDLWSA